MTLPVIAVAILYVSIIILCTIAATLYVSRSIRRGEPISKALSVMTIAMTVYTVFEMITGLFDRIIDSAAYNCMIVASDLSFFALVGSWVIMTVLLTGNPYVIKIKGLIVYIVIYAVIVEPLGLLRSMAGLSESTVDTLQNAATIINLLFDLTILVLSLYFMFYGLKKMKENSRKGWVIGLSGILSAYLVYISWWDTMGSVVETGNMDRYKYFDPILAAYVLVCILVIWLLVWRGDSPIGFDISKTIGINQDNVDKWKALSEEYKLTMREIETAQMVATGKSNPDIADLLFISENTVKHHLNSIYRKTGTKNRFELMNLVNEGKN